MLRTMKYGINAAVLAGLVAAPVVWAGIDKSVRLVVDGRERTVSTTAANVGEVLAAHGYRVDSHDLVAPNVGSSVADGARIVLRRGRLLKLDVDGSTAQVWTTAPTVSAALAQLGYSQGDFVSVSRSRRLPLTTTAIAIRTPSTVTVVHDGTRESVQSTAPTVAAVLTQLNVSLRPQDLVSAPLASTVRPDEVIRVQRVTTSQVTRTESLPYGTTTRKDSKLSKGDTDVVRAGRVGKVRATYAVLYIDGKMSSRTRLTSQTLRAAKQQIVAMGTKKVRNTSSSGGGSHASPADTPNAPTPSPGSAKAIAKQLLAARGWGDDQYSCLVSMWNRESGWRVHASNGGSGAYGIPQALPGSKMASAGPDWQDNATTQIKWGIGYIAARYNTPCGAWSFWQAHGYY